MRLKATLNPVKQIGGIAGDIVLLPLSLCITGHLFFYSDCRSCLNNLSGAGQDLQGLNSLGLLWFRHSIYAGVSVGQQFLSRAEMVVIGLHNHWLNGIDYIGTGRGKVSLSMCIVLHFCLSCCISGG